MAERKVYVEAKVRLIITMAEGVEVADVINEMDYNFISATSLATIVDTEILEYHVKDSK